MRPREDEGPFRKSAFPTSVFPRRIFPWMGGEDDGNQQSEAVKNVQHSEKEDEDDK